MPVEIPVIVASEVLPLPSASYSRREPPKTGKETFERAIKKGDANFKTKTVRLMADFSVEAMETRT